MVLLIALKEIVSSEYQRDQNVEKIFMAWDIKHINATRLTLAQALYRFWLPHDTYGDNNIYELLKFIYK